MRFLKAKLICIIIISNIIPTLPVQIVLLMFHKQVIKPPKYLISNRKKQLKSNQKNQIMLNKTKQLKKRIYQIIKQITPTINYCKTTAINSSLQKVNTFGRKIILLAKTIQVYVINQLYITVLNPYKEEECHTINNNRICLYKKKRFLTHN